MKLIGLDSRRDIRPGHSEAMLAAPPLGILIGTSTPPGQLRALAARAEQRGFSEVWLAEEYFGYGGFSGTALALAATERIRVGLGIVSATGRHPAVTAMEIASLATAFPGRLAVAIGHGPSRRLGLEPASPLGSLEEAVTAIRQLLAGEEADGTGTSFEFHQVKLPHVPERPIPILTGVMRPRSLELSGRIADGTVMSVLAGPRYLEESAIHIRRGMRQADRSEHALPTYVLCHVGTSKEESHAALRPLIAYYLARLGATNPLSGAYGHGPAITAALAKGGVEALDREMPDSWIDTLAMAGNPHDVASGIRAYAAAGATSVIAVPRPEKTTEQLDRLAAEVLPLLKRG
jgi:5,10-methylenetetrahydromethanopterin reductase